MRIHILESVMSIASSSEWKSLERLAKRCKNMSLRAAFGKDPARFDKFNILLENGGNEMLFDYSKNLIDEEVMEELVKLANVAKVEQMRAAMFGGEAINFTENRAVLHVALRHQGKCRGRIVADARLRLHICLYICCFHICKVVLSICRTQMHGIFVAKNPRNCRCMRECATAILRIPYINIY